MHVADGWMARHREHLNLAESEEMRDDRAYLESVRERLRRKRDSSREPSSPAASQRTRSSSSPTMHGVDLIAMSTHGHRFLADLIYGSTASKVRHTVDVPVLLLRARG